MKYFLHHSLQQAKPCYRCAKLKAASALQKGNDMPCLQPPCSTEPGKACTMRPAPQTVFVSMRVNGLQNLATGSRTGMHAH